MIVVILIGRWKNHVDTQKVSFDITTTISSIILEETN